MNGPPTLARAGVVATLILSAGILLALPVSTHEPSPASAPAEPQAVVQAQGGLAAAVVPPSPDRGALTPTSDRPAPAGMVIGIDPETGQLGMPTRDQMKELSELEQRRIEVSPSELVEVHHPDGSVSIDLQGQFQEFTTVRTGTDGKLIFDCVTGPENAERAVMNPTPGAGQAETESRPQWEER